MSKSIQKKKKKLDKLTVVILLQYIFYAYSILAINVL